MPPLVNAAVPDAVDPPAVLRWLAPAVLAAGLAVTAGLAAWSWQREAAEQKTRFDHEADRVVQALTNRVQTYIDTLPGLRALAANGHGLDDAAFARYVDTLSLERRYPGIALTFVAERVRGQDRVAYVAQVRADRSRRPEGHPDFDIVPPGTRPEHMVLRHVQPVEAGAIGYDLFDPDQRYRAEVDAAMRDGGYVATGPLLLARDRDASLSPALSSVVIRAATYATPLPPADADERMRQAIGVVGVAFRTHELLRSVLTPEQQAALHVRITDLRSAELGQPALVFDSHWLLPGSELAPRGPLQRVALPVADRRWDVEIGLMDGAAPAPITAAGTVAALLGVLLSCTLAAITHMLVRANAQEARKVREATARLLAETRSLHESEQRFRMLFEHSMDAVLRTRPDGTVLAANAAACTLFRCNEERLCALGRAGLVDRDDERLAALLEARDRDGRAAGQLRMRRADGSTFEAEVSSNLYTEADGRTTASLILRDVTERERAAAQQAELTAILDATPDFVGSADPQGRITFLNRAARRMLGLGEQQDVTGYTFAHCHPPWAVRTVQEVGVPAAKRNGVWAGQLAIACADGRELPVSQVIVCLRDASGQVARLSTIARDLSEVHAAQAQQRALEARLQEAHKMESIGTLAGGVAHDFNNVLAVILGNLAIAREDLGPGHAVQHPLALAHQAAARARGLVQQILAFSRRLPQRREVQPLAPLVEESLSLLRSTLPASAVLEAQVDPEPLLVEVDAGQIQQVLLNLCTNALQALPAHVGRIRVEVARTDDGQARLSVIDNGSGMDAATVARIFEPFFTTKPVGQGTGLGLAVVHGIDVLLPLREPSPDTSDSPARDESSPAGHGEHILLADDDEVVGLTTEALLQRAGYRVTRVGSGLAAIEAVREAPREFALLITDFNMPGLSGLGVAEHLAATAPGLPVIITSGFVTEELIERARMLGVRSVLLKEHSIERLAALVREALAVTAV